MSSLRAVLFALATGWAGAASAQTADHPVRVGSLTPVLVFANASPPVKLVMVGLVVAGVAALVVVALRLRRGAPGGGAYLGGLVQAAPLVGLFGAVYGLLNSALGISNVRPAPSMTVLAPGWAEALLAFGLGLLVAIVAVICRWTLEGRTRAA